METACAKFFNLPELVLMVGSHLSKKCIVQLKMCSTKLNQMCTPALYNTLDLLEHHKTLPDSPDALMALSSQAHVIRDIVMSGDFLIRYYSGIIALQDLHHMASGFTPRRPSWLPPTTPRTSCVVPFPPMTNLTKFSCTLAAYPGSPSSTLSTLFANGGYLAQLCYVIQLSAHLTSLTLYDIPVYHIHDINLLARTIAGLSSLQEFHSRICSTPNAMDQVVPILFFSLPQTIRIFHLYLDHFSTMFGNTPSGPATVTIQEPTIRRQDPLLQLTHWQVEAASGFDACTFRSIIEHCPGLVEIELPKIRRVEEVLSLSRFIAERCPKLRTLTRYEDTPGLYGELLFAVMTMMPEDTLKSIEAVEVANYPDYLAGCFYRHSESLTNITIRYAELTADTILTVLFHCAALESFDVETEGFTDSEVELSDLVEAPWTCTRIRTLKLVINIGDVQQLKSPFCLREAPVVLTPEEAEQMSLLEDLYRQIGSLTELEHLSLSISVPHDINDDEDLEDEEFEYLENSDRFSFPCLLTLGDVEKGLPGHLGLLAGLKKLKTLEGFVSATTKETTVTMGWREAEWIEKNWRNLRRAKFFREPSLLRPPFHWLQERMPLLDMRT